MLILVALWKIVKTLFLLYSKITFTVSLLLTLPEQTEQDTQMYHGLLSQFGGSGDLEGGK